MVKEATKIQSKMMLLEGKAPEEILQTIGEENIDIGTIHKQKGWMATQSGQFWAAKEKAKAQALVGTPETQPNGTETMVVIDIPHTGLPTGNGNGFPAHMPQQNLATPSNGHGIPPQATVNPQDQAQFASITQQQLMLMADPIIRKVSMNPRFYLWFDYFRSKGMNGDPGDFINDLLEYFLNDQGYRIAIEKNERSVVR